MKIFIKDLNHPRFGQIGELIDSESLEYLIIEFPDSIKSEIIEITKCEQADIFHDPINAFRNAIERDYWQKRYEDKSDGDWWKCKH